MRALVLTGTAIALAACGPGSTSGDCDKTLLAGDLVITEVFADSKAPPGGSGTDEGKEWFEIYNASDRPVELKGLTITHSRPDGSRAKSHIMEDITIAPGQYLTLGNSAPDLLPPFVDYGYAADLGDFFNTDGGKLEVTCGSNEIDVAGYDLIKEGRSRQLSASMAPDYTSNDDGTTWCESSGAEFDPGNFGTPGSESDCTPIVIGQCNDGGTMRDAIAPMPGDLVITEVMPKPSSVSATVGQWFEVLATRDVDLNGVVLDRANDTASGKELASADCLRVAAGSYVLFARSDDMSMNGGLTTIGTFPFSINPTTNTPDIQLTYGGMVIDAVTWTTSTSGRSLSLDPDFSTTTGNDDAANFCNGEGIYNGSDHGTPAAVNAQCPSVAPAGKCDGGGGTFRDIVKPTPGQLVITEFLANPATTPSDPPDGTTDDDKEWFEIKNTGAAAFDLNELGIANGAAAPTPTLVQSSTCISVAPGGLALFARSKDMARNAGLPAVDATFSFKLTDSGVNAGIQIFDGATLLDAVKWTSVSSGRALGLDPDHHNTTDNDMAAPTPAATAEKVYCLGAMPYGDNSNQGTPKAANPQCP
ncbi:MAG: lamin tail domain-containing protein [Kofleriaceae bacterium]|nr:lamin tail domain-containing protein [Kofleriaceae bacterium]